MSKTVLCIVGKSGSDKTSLALHLRNYIPIVSSRTTRPARDGEINGEPPCHKFLSTDDYIKDVVTNGKVAIGDLIRGDDIILADTQFGEHTYWALASDIFKYDQGVVGYIIDPIGVAALNKAIHLAGELIIRYGFKRQQAPLLWQVANAKVKVLYVDAVEKVIELTPKSRRDRDESQKLGWELCDTLASFRFTTPYIEDERERKVLIGLQAKKLSDVIYEQL